LSAFSLANFRRNAGLVLPLFRLGNDDVLHAVLTASTGGLEDNAEGLVKSLLHQLCLQEPALSRYAEPFIDDPLGEQNRPKAKLSIENMCQCLQDILTESSIGRIFLVINNLHLLEDSPLTDKLLAFIKADVSKAKAKGSKAKWVLTSQKDEALQKIFGLDSNSRVRKINLDAEEYGAQLGEQLRKYAWERTNYLRGEKGYTLALAYLLLSLRGTPTSPFPTKKQTSRRNTHLRPLRRLS